MLQINKCYKIVNSNGYAVDIGVIDGAVDLNGRLYSKLFMIK